MQSANSGNAVRRSSRVPITLPIVVTSLEPAAPFSELCETLVVSAHGCVLSSPTKLDAGVPVQFQRKGGRATMAHVVDCQPMPGRQGWQLGARLDRPENFWGLKPIPKDWARVPAAVNDTLVSTLPADKRQAMPPDQAAASLKIALDRVRKQLSDEHLKTVLAELVSPIEAQVTEIKVPRIVQHTPRGRARKASAARSGGRCAGGRVPFPDDPAAIPQRLGVRAA